MSKPNLCENFKFKCDPDVPPKKVEKKPEPPPPTEAKSVFREPLIDLPHFLRVVGPKHFSILRNFVPSIITYTFATALIITFMTDWKTVLQYLPYYNGKYAVEQMPVIEKEAKPEPTEKEAESEEKRDD